MPRPLFPDGRETFEKAARKAGVDTESCALLAASKVVFSEVGIGINNHSEDAVREELAKVGHSPASVEIVNADDMFRMTAKIGCGLCEQVVCISGPIDAQGFGPAREDRKCPIFESVEEGLVASS